MEPKQEVWVKAVVKSADGPDAKTRKVRLWVTNPWGQRSLIIVPFAAVRETPPA